MPPLPSRNTTKRAKNSPRGIVASAAKLRAAADARRYCDTASAGTATSGGSHARHGARAPGADQQGRQALGVFCKLNRGARAGTGWNELELAADLGGRV